MALRGIARLPQTIRNLQRMREILLVVGRHGFGDVLARLEQGIGPGILGRLIPFRRARQRAAQFATEERFRMTLEELGPTFVKFGQVLSTRPDLIPMSLVEELRKLQENVLPFPSDEARSVIEGELRRRIGEVFSTFQDTPIAAGSIAQVHAAELREGLPVVVKVQRPNLERILRTDVEILEFLAGAIERDIPESQLYQPTAIVQEFRRTVLAEIDFLREAASMERFARNFAGDARFTVPRVYREWSTSRVLVMERVEGIRADNRTRLLEGGYDLRQIAVNGVEFVLTQVFVHGFFHADPHPGNILLLPGNRICDIDFGQMGVVDATRREELLAFMLAVVAEDSDQLLRVLERMELVDETTDRRAMRRDTEELIARFGGQALERIDFAKFFSALFEAFTRHQIVMPPDILLLGKALATMDGIARVLCPELDVVAVIRPLLLERYLARLGDPKAMARELAKTADQYVGFLRSFPANAGRILEKLRRDELAIHIRLLEQDKALAQRDRAVNRLCLAILGATIVLASCYGLVGTEPGRLTWIVAVGGLALGGFLLAFLALALWRSGGTA